MRSGEKSEKDDKEPGQYMSTREPPEYTTVMKTPTGSTHIIQVEQTAKGRPTLPRLLARIAGFNSSYQTLINLLIQKRLDESQLSAIKKAKREGFNEKKLKLLVESDLSGDELLSVIDLFMQEKAVK
ncbi:MAG: hypothetical protein K6E10_05590 [Eubacterium sp.]|nr:hypothetical protein [Eubacterium sp.]